MESILLNYPAKTEQVESDMEAFESDLKKVLRVSPTFIVIKHPPYRGCLISVVLLTLA